MAARKPARPLAFINIPYAKRYEKVYLAFIAGYPATVSPPPLPCATQPADFNSIAFTR